AGVLGLQLAGLTVNIVVLFSLILAVGMLVDDAVIVSEFAERRMSEGMAPREAYALAAKRMSGPVIAATATRVAAFSPLLFWPGVVGQFMKYLPITLIGKYFMNWPTTPGQNRSGENAATRVAVAAITGPDMRFAASA